MATGRDIVTAAFRKCGLRITSETQKTDALARLNDLLSSWASHPLRAIPAVVEESLSLVAGTATYTWGSGGTFNTTRPLRIAAAFLRDSANVDHPLDTTMSLEDYALIADKVSRARPARVYYAQEYPLGKVYFDAPPDAAYTFKTFSEKPLSSIATLDTTVNLPDEYERTLVHNLAVELAPEFNIALDQTVIQLATGGVVALENRNRRPVPLARVDAALTRALWR